MPIVSVGIGVSSCRHSGWAGPGCTEHSEDSDFLALWRDGGHASRSRACTTAPEECPLHLSCVLQPWGKESTMGPTGQIGASRISGNFSFRGPARRGYCAERNKAPGYPHHTMHAGIVGPARFGTAGVTVYGARYSPAPGPTGIPTSIQTTSRTDHTPGIRRSRGASWPRACRSPHPAGISAPAR